METLQKSDQADGIVNGSVEANCEEYQDQEHDENLKTDANNNILMLDQDLDSSDEGTSKG